MDTEWTPSLWLDTFNELLDDDSELDYGDRWTLKVNYNKTDEITKEERRKGWKVSTHQANGKFQCASCKKTWASAQVVLVFRYRLLSGQGTVIMRPFGQACLRCRGDKFNLPGFDKKEVERALLRQFYKIRKNCYHEEEEEKAKDNGRPSSESEAWTKPHKKNLCQACRMGHCCQDNYFQCASCRRIWPSVRVVVLFCYRLRGGKGAVTMRPFGQDDNFHLPGFNKEEVKEALLRQFSKIWKNCYGEEDESEEGDSGATRQRSIPHEKTKRE